MTQLRIQQQNKMPDSNGQCRDDRDRMEESEDVGLRIIESLRGRLIAERLATKAAKEEGDNLAKRLEELERKLAEEIKCRKRAEKRQKCALKKLESLEHLDDTQCSLQHQRSQGTTRSDSVQSGSLQEAKGIEVSIDLLDQPPSTENNKGFNSQELSTEALRISSGDNKKDNEDSMAALIPACEQLNVEACNLQNKDNVQRVLVALKNVKEMLLSAMGREANIYHSAKEL